MRLRAYHRLAAALPNYTVVLFLPHSLEQGQLPEVRHITSNANGRRRRIHCQTMAALPQLPHTKKRLLPQQQSTGRRAAGFTHSPKILCNLRRILSIWTVIQSISYVTI